MKDGENFLRFSKKNRQIFKSSGFLQKFFGVRRVARDF